MKNLLIVVLVLLVAAGVLGYWQGWFTVTKDGKGTDSKVKVEVNQEKFKQDKAAFSKTVSEKAKATKEQLAGLWKKTEGLKGDDKAQAQKELGDLEKRRDRLEQQIKELEDAQEPDRFTSIQQDLSKSLADVDKKIEELSKKLEKENVKDTDK